MKPAVKVLLAVAALPVAALPVAALLKAAYAKTYGRETRLQEKERAKQKMEDDVFRHLQKDHQRQRQ